MIHIYLSNRSVFIKRPYSSAMISGMDDLYGDLSFQTRPERPVKLMYRGLCYPVLIVFKNAGARKPFFFKRQILKLHAPKRRDLDSEVAIQIVTSDFRRLPGHP